MDFLVRHGNMPDHQEYPNEHDWPQSDHEIHRGRLFRQIFRRFERLRRAFSGSPLDNERIFHR
jgi:hypothetical protein